MSSLLFGLYFGRVVKHMKLDIHTADAIYVAQFAILIVLYADDIILLALSPSSLQSQLTCLSDFASLERLCMSIPKMLILLENCFSELKVSRQPLK